MNRRIKIMNFYVDNLTISETITRVEEIIREKSPVQHVVVNAGKAVMLQKNVKLREIINKCQLINADGQSIVWASKFLGFPLIERVAGIDLMEELIKRSAEKGYSIFFFGAQEESVKKVVKHYQDKYHNLKIAGYRNGYFNENEELNIIEEIRASQADILLVAFSSPQKEYWLSKNGTLLNVPFQMGVGGSFDVIAGITKRAPIWMQNYGLEWFYRFLQEPRRMWKRYLLGNFKFIYYLIKEKYKGA